MIELIELVIGLFVTAAIYYAMYFYGARAVLEVAVVIVISFSLAVLFITETMKSVAEEAVDEDITDLQAYGSSALDTERKIAAYRVLAASTNAFNKILNWCTETLEIEEEEDDPYE